MRELGKLLRDTFAVLLRDRTSAVLASATVLLMLWGNLGSVNLLSTVWSGWTGPGSYGNPRRAVILAGLPFDQEWLSFVIGALLLVGVPGLLIKLAYRERLADYGLGLPARGTGPLVLWSSIALFVVGLPGIWFGAHQPEIRAIYPLFRHFTGDGQFVVYELGYLVFFFASEFIFRGYILFGAAQSRPGYHAVFVAFIAHVLWHLGKPVHELWSALPWSIFAGAVALATRSIYHLIVVHWLLNVFMDLIIWKGW